MDVLEAVDWKQEGWQALVRAVRAGKPRVTDAAPPRDSAMWRIYGPLVAAARENRPFVIGQLGQSLDGRIATGTATGQPEMINGRAGIEHLHRLRALVDAVVVGVGTAIADNPQLTVRHVDGPHPIRVVVDPSGRLPDDARMLCNDGVGRIVIQACNHTRPDGIECIELPCGPEGMNPASILAALRDRGLRRILIEGGAHTLSRFLGEGLLDRLHVLVAPLILGHGISGIDLPGLGEIGNAIRPAMRAYGLPGGDILMDCELTR